MRWLVPDDFGMFAMVIVVISFFNILRDSGISSALIQKEKVSSNDISSAFWWHVLLGVLVAVFLVITSDYFNSFYKVEHLNYIVLWLSIDFVIVGVGLVPISLLQKELKYRELFYIRLIALILSSLVGLSMAFIEMAYMSLVGKMIAWTMINSFISLAIMKRKPQFIMSKSSIQGLLRFGVPVTGNHLLSYLVRNTDDFFIGRVIGSMHLGYYNRAYALMLLPMSSITSVLNNVMFSTWSKMQNNREGIKKMFIKVSGGIALLSFPLMVLLAIYAYDLIELIFGTKWLAMTQTFQILALIGMLQSVTSLSGLIFMVFDENKQLFKINLITSISTIILIIWSVYTFKSIEITAAVYGLSSLLFLYPIYHFTGKLIRASFWELIQPIILPFILSIFSGFLSYQLFNTMVFRFILLKMSICVILALTVYFILCLIFKVNALFDFINLLEYLKKDVSKKD